MMEWFVTSSALILLVLALRALLRGKLSLRVQYALWLLVAVRLLVPLSVSSSLLPVSAADLIPEPGPRWDSARYQVNEIPFTGVGAVQNSPYYVQPNGTVTTSDSFGFPEVDEEAGVIRVYADFLSPRQVVLALWGMGSVLTAAVMLWMNIRFSFWLSKRRRPLEGSDCKLPVYVAEGLHSPCLYGLFRPAIYLTPGTAEDETILTHVLAHEMTHYAHGDHIWSALRCLCLTLHWYNPLVWLAAFLSRRDGELACDEGAVARLGEGQRIPYGRTLVGLVDGRVSRPADLLTCSTAMTEGRKTIQQRVALLVKAPKTGKIALAAALILAALAVVFTFSKGREAEPTVLDEFRAQVEQARAVRVAEPVYSSRAYPDAIADRDLLTQAKEVLSRAEAVSPEEGKRDWNDIATSVHFSRLGLCLGAADGEGKTYYLSGQEAADYILIDEPDGPGCIPVAALDRGTIDTLLSLARRQSERNRERKEQWIEGGDAVTDALAYLASDEKFLAENARLWSAAPEEVARWLTDDTAPAAPMMLALRYGDYGIPELENVAPCWHLVCWDREEQLSYIFYLPDAAREALQGWCSDMGVSGPQLVIRNYVDDQGLLCEGGSYVIDDIVRTGGALYAVTRYQRSEGEGGLWLFVLEEVNGALTVRDRFEGALPLSMGVELYKVDTRGQAVIYGAVSDQLWTDLDAAPKKVEFTGVQALYGQEEQTVVVKNNSAFLICLPGETEIKDIVFLAGEGAAGRLSELPVSEDPIGNLNTYGSPYTP